MQLPETGFLRESQILPQREITAEQAERNRALPNSTRPKRARPATAGLIPVSHATWWRGIREGRYPQPVKIGARVTAWRVEDIRALIANGIA
jgi:predicted DNA-binding transcriptional regulator AlpA